HGGGWTVLWGVSGADNGPVIVSDVARTGNPLTFGDYNLSLAVKAWFSSRSTETVFVRSDGPWLRMDAPLLTARILEPGSQDYHQEVIITADSGATRTAVMGWTNYNISRGGDYGITTIDHGFDHHSALYRHLNA